MKTPGNFAKSKIGIFGATFDPPHIAHFIAAEFIAQSFELDKVLLVPAYVNPLKQELKTTPMETRLKMVDSVARDNPLFELCTLESERGGISYMIDTVLALRDEYPAPKFGFCLMIGADTAADFHLWREHEKLSEETDIIVFNRPGYDLHEISRNLKIPHVTAIIPMLEISSTAIRRNIAGGLPYRYFLPEPVYNIIESEGLYR